MITLTSLGEVADAALQQHLFWGSLLLGLVLWGPGRSSLDTWWSAGCPHARAV